MACLSLPSAIGSVERCRSYLRYPARSGESNPDHLLTMARCVFPVLQMRKLSREVVCLIAVSQKVHRKLGSLQITPRRQKPERHSNPVPSKSRHLMLLHSSSPLQSLSRWDRLRQAKTGRGGCGHHFLLGPCSVRVPTYPKIWTAGCLPQGQKVLNPPFHGLLSLPLKQGTVTFIGWSQQEVTD